jgi:mannosyltransferase
MSRLQASFLLFFIVLSAIVLRSYDITARSLWFDEAFSWRLIHFPFAEMIARDAQDVHPPLYYILLQGWSKIFTSSILSLRMFSVFCSGIALYVAYLFSSYGFRSRVVGFLSVILLAVSGWDISYAWEARMYPLGMIFAFFSSYALLKALRGVSLKWALLYGVSAAALVYTHYYGYFTVAAQALFAIIFLIRAKNKKLFLYAGIAGVVAIGLYSPWIPVFLHQNQQVRAAYWVPPVASTSIPDTFYQFFIPTKEIPPHHIPLIFLSLLPIIGSLALWTWLALRKNIERDAAVFTMLLGVVPFIIGILVSFSGRSLYNDRFFAFAGIFLFCGLAYAITRIPNKALKISVGILVVLALILSCIRYWHELDITNKPGGHGATQYVFEQRSNTDPILVSSPYVYFAIENYATDEFLAPSVTHLFSQTGELSHFSGGPILVQSDIVGPQDIQKYSGTVWVIDTTGYTETPFEAPSNWKEIEQKKFPEVFVYQGDIIVRKFQVK